MIHTISFTESRERSVPANAGRDHRSRLYGARAVCVGTLLVISGCFTSGPARFRLNTEGRDAAEITSAQREAIAETLEELFGMPDAPKVPDDVTLQLPLLQRAAGPVCGNRQGNQAGLYRQHCAACHELSGGGGGATAGAQNPYPRDFRNGWFKYTSTAGGAKPTREDLDRIIRNGIPATAMPSFERLSDDEVDALVEYVRYLSIRGETELYLLQLVVDEDEYLPLDVDEILEDAVVPAAESWVVARQTEVVFPPQPEYAPGELAASVERGGRLFLSEDAKCFQCHGESGRGDGEQSELYDDWNKGKKGATPGETRKLARRYRLPVQRLRPRNFTEGIFRGGSEPEDVFWRIHVGIKGTPMPAAGRAEGNTGVLTSDEIRDVANYVRSLSRKVAGTLRVP